MLRKEELAFIKAITNLQVSPAILKELRTAPASSKKKRKTVVSAGAAAPRSVLSLKRLNVL
jgi:hypothetical protein